ncbi:hypothetical protein CLOSTMETH_01058 [[Clostridium] methylpentosum DSM 5476]|uniref:Uncharacterized protein n=1 Tax=[Clostridium] methylpentosum DSM 5476 TaxID=537013 RepID=C0EB41_9FIRM|nr:hypothetical protein CLOSTMETH_01058 [[Clostridium] methylpentosum DSM 5476]
MTFRLQQNQALPQAPIKLLIFFCRSHKNTSFLHHFLVLFCCRHPHGCRGLK